MDEHKILLVANIVRELFENIRDKKDIDKELTELTKTLPKGAIKQKKCDASFRLDSFPKGCCVDTSYILGTILQEYALALNIVDEIVCVVANLCHGTNHMWVKCGDLNVDITLDQFNNEYNTDYPAVYMQSNHPLSQKIVCKKEIIHSQLGTYIAQHYLKDILKEV